MPTRVKMYQTPFIIRKTSSNASVPELRFINAEDLREYNEAKFNSIYSFIPKFRRDLRDCFYVNIESKDRENNFPILNTTATEDNVKRLVNMLSHENIGTLITRIEAGIANPPKGKIIDPEKKNLDSYFFPLLDYGEIKSFQDASSWKALTDFWKDFYTVIGINPLTGLAGSIEERKNAYDNLEKSRWHPKNVYANLSLVAINELMKNKDEPEFNEIAIMNGFNPEIKKNILYDSNITEYMTNAQNYTRGEWK
jgi:hypothetical protein